MIDCFEQPADTKWLLISREAGLHDKNCDWSYFARSINPIIFVLTRKKSKLLLKLIQLICPRMFAVLVNKALKIHFP